MIDQTSQMFITGPDVIKTVTGEDVTMEELGGAHTHMAKSGTAHYVASGEQDAFDYVRELLSYLPSNNYADPPRYPAPVPAGAIEDNLTDEDVELDTLIPDSPNQPYDMHEVITRILDEDEFLEVQAGYATNIIVGFGRIEGRPVGIVANQPTQFAGCLDINASEKAARFVRTCDCFNIPIVMLVDVPGFLPGTDQEYNGIIRRGAKLLYAYGEATVAKITVITRKAYGGAYCVMGSKDMGADVNVAGRRRRSRSWGVRRGRLRYRQQLSEAAKNGEDVDALRLELQQDYEDTLVNPYIAAERGYVDAVIPPSHTRGYVATALRLLERKITQIPPKKHGNIPL
jgi:propionyl-CoA carboxylase beta chain